MHIHNDVIILLQQLIEVLSIRILYITDGNPEPYTHFPFQKQLDKPSMLYVVWDTVDLHPSVMIFIK